MPITFESWHLAPCLFGFWFRPPVASSVQNLGPLGSIRIPGDPNRQPYRPPHFPCDNGLTKGTLILVGRLSR